MYRLYERSKVIEKENELLLHQIRLSKRKRDEASTNAAKVAESNYCLQKTLSAVRKELYSIKCNNKPKTIK